MTTHVRPTSRTGPLTAPSAPGSTPADRFLAAAKQFIGQPYQWGGGHGGPMGHPGPVDCSGLVTQAGYMSGNPGLAGDAASQQAHARPISKSELQPGDLCFCGSPAHHVGIYIGNGQVLEAPHTGAQVHVTSVDNFDNFGRVFDQAGQPLQGLPTTAAPGGGGPSADGRTAAPSGNRSSLGLPGGGGGDAGGATGGGATGGANGPAAAAGSVGSAPSGDLAQWIDEAMKILTDPPPQGLGIPASKIDKNMIAEIIKHESGGNPNAINRTDSNAQAGHPSQGLMQTIPSTFDAYKGPAQGGITDPVANIVAGVNYAVHRYGSIQQVPGIVALSQGKPYVGY